MRPLAATAPLIGPLIGLLIGLLTAPAARADGTPRAADAFPPGAPPMPACNAPREGILACLAGTSCVCRFERGGSLVGRPDRFAWDCGALRPSCAEGPAGMGPPRPPVAVFPPGVDGMGDRGWR